MQGAKGSTRKIQELRINEGRPNVMGMSRKYFDDLNYGNEKESKCQEREECGVTGRVMLAGRK